MPIYNLTDVDDCARLIISSIPCESLQETQFALIARLRGAPTKQQIIERIKEMDLPRSEK